MNVWKNLRDVRPMRNARIYQGATSALATRASRETDTLATTSTNVAPDLPHVQLMPRAPINKGPTHAHAMTDSKVMAKFVSILTNALLTNFAIPTPTVTTYMARSNAPAKKDTAAMDVSASI